jgi:hypothetical protein
MFILQKRKLVNLPKLWKEDDLCSHVRSSEIQYLVRYLGMQDPCSVLLPWWSRRWHDVTIKVISQGQARGKTSMQYVPMLSPLLCHPYAAIQ